MGRCEWIHGLIQIEDKRVCASTARTAIVEVRSSGVHRERDGEGIRICRIVGPNGVGGCGRNCIWCAPDCTVAGLEREA